MKRNIAGFTLVELMISILILGLVAVLAVPMYGRFTQNWKLNGEVEQFAAMMRTARSAAVMKNISTVFVFDIDRNEYFYFEDEDRDGSLDAGEYRSATHDLYDGIVFTAHTLSSTTLSFGHLGNTRESGSITFRNNFNTRKAVRIMGGTGNITVD